MRIQNNTDLDLDIELTPDGITINHAEEPDDFIVFHMRDEQDAGCLAEILNEFSCLSAWADGDLLFVVDDGEGLEEDEA